MSAQVAAPKPRRKLLIAAFVVLLVGTGLAYKPATLYWAIAHPKVQNLPLPAELWAMEGPKGKALTERNAAGTDHKALKPVFQSQIYGSYCGVASAVIALGALGQTGVTQATFFTDKTEPIRSEKAVFYGGMTLDELGGLLKAHGADVTVTHAGDSTVDAFRQAAKANLQRTGDVLLVNYLRRAISQKSGGHVSPVSAYDAQTDRMLVLDVSTYKYPPVWVGTAALFAAMNTTDSSADKTRGWVRVQLPTAGSN
ncbi:MAG: phytochelatin synthase family protein [Myxococcales bacterium]|nr:phytochelatin synthase family protein [Myxococcales bacterium]